MRLQDKGVQCPTHCVSCDSSQEDMAHLFFHCSFAVQVWRFAGLWSHIQNVIATFVPVTYMIFNLLETLPTEQKQTLAAMVWSIWKHRNLKVWENKTETAATVVERARVMISDWQLANLSLPAATAAVTTGSAAHLSPNAATSSSPAAAMVRWKKSSVGRYKCNVDATFSSSFNRTGIGICIRDEEGTFVLAKMVSFPCLHQVAVGEAIGLFEALQWLSDMSFDNVDFELDSKVTCDAFLSHRDDISEFGHVIASCKALFSAFFTNSRIEFTRRQANAAAHVLAREAIFLSSPITYYHISSCINNIIINEMQWACFSSTKKN